MHERLIQPDPVQLAWPEDGLEAVPRCPACGGGERSLLYRGLADYVFFCAPGRWDLHRCHGCQSLYLDPRPTPDTIHLAYTEYFTHTSEAGGSVPEPAGGLARVRRLLANGYKNWRFGDDLRPASRLGIAAAYLRPGWRQAVDRQYRHLLFPRSGGRLLDVGCGNGAFLRKAQSVGWCALGIDPDPKAVAAARAHGLDVEQGGLERFDGQSELFDVVTLSHVIEHVHDPADTLQRIFRLLKPGGRVWIDTPNAQAHGHRLFRRHWRGLEPPRHLAIFSWHALENLLARVGFGTVRRHVCTNNFAWLANASQNIEKAAAEDCGSHAPRANRVPVGIHGILFSVLTLMNYRNSEFITLVARKPISRG